jgi:hypothetical protein
MKKLLIITGAAEAATGMALMVAPALVGRLLLGAELAGVSVVVARVAGIALLALGVGCWPGPALLGMLTYNTLGSVYFGYPRLAVNGSGRCCGQQSGCTRSLQSFSAAPGSSDQGWANRATG